MRSQGGVSFFWGQFYLTVISGKFSYTVSPSKMIIYFFLLKKKFV